MNKFVIPILLGLVVFASAASNPIFLNETYDTGFVNLQEDRGMLWYWLFESRQSPSNDPLVLVFTNAGRSSAFSVLTQNGPYRINRDNTTLRINPYSWNNIANLLYVDYPLGAGFSIANSIDAIPTNHSQVGDDTYYLLKQFLQQHPEFKGRDLYVAGSAFGSHAVAWTCVKILNNSDSLDLNLKGWQVNDPFSFPEIQYQTWPQYAYEHDLINRSFYNDLVQEFVPINELLSHTDDSDDLLEGTDDAYVLLDEITNPDGSQLNYYDIEQPCIANSSTVQCFNFDNVVQFMNQSKVLQALNITQSYWAFGNSTSTNQLTETEYGDNMNPLFATLLDAGVRGIFYCSEYDLFFNCIGVQNLTEAIDWKGQTNFTNVNFENWNNYGDYKHSSNLTLLRVNNSGLFYSMDQPGVSLLGLDRLIKNEGW